MNDTLNPSEHDLNDLAAFAEGRLDDRGRARVVEHLAGCRPCRETLALLAKGLGESPSARPRVWRWMPAAAALVIGVTATGVLLLRRPVPTAPQIAVPATTQPAAPPRSAAPPAPPTPTVATPRGPAVRGSGVRSVGRKRFRLVAGEWIDESYDQAAALPTVDIRTTAERARVMTQGPALAPFVRLGPRVTVVLDGTVYRFDLGSL